MVGMNEGTFVGLHVGLEGLVVGDFEMVGVSVGDEDGCDDG